MATLLQSARTFLVESLRNYAAGELVLAIVHVTTATELLLKERLARIHPNLIYVNLDSPSIQRSKTIGLRELPQRLANLGVVLPTAQVQLVHEVAAWRNALVHFCPDFPRDEALAKLGQLFDFLGTFLSQHLDQNLKAVLPRNLYRVVRGLLTEWEKIVTHAQEAARHAGRALLPHSCPECGTNDVLVSSDPTGARCYLCEREFAVGVCPICRREAVGEDVGDGHNVYHYACLDDYGLDHLSMLEEMRRGK